MKTRIITVIILLFLVILLLSNTCAYAEESGTRYEPPVRTTYYANGGSCSVAYTDNIPGTTYGTMPTPTWYGHAFLGWFESPTTEGYEVTGSTVVPPNANAVYAHWAYLYEEITNKGSQKNLNISGSNLTALSNGKNVTVWTITGSGEQKWYISGHISQVYIKSIIDKSYGLNAHRSGTNWNCNMHKVIGNETDAQVDFIEYGDYYRIKLHNYNKYLTATGTANGSNAYWSAYSNSDYQLWDVAIPTLR